MQSLSIKTLPFEMLGTVQELCGYSFQPPKKQPLASIKSVSLNQ